MAYFVGSVNGDRAQCSSTNGRGGFVTVEESKANSNLVIVAGQRRRYPVWLNETSNGAMQGEKMFRRYAVKVVITKGRCHVWIKRMGGPRRQGGMSSMNRQGGNYGNYRR